MDKPDLVADDVALHAHVDGTTVALLLDLNVVLRHMRAIAMRNGGSALFDADGNLRDHVLSAAYRATEEYNAEVIEREAYRRNRRE